MAIRPRHAGGWCGSSNLCGLSGGWAAPMLSGRAFIGEERFNWLTGNDRPFSLRIAKSRLVTRADGSKVRPAPPDDPAQDGRERGLNFEDTRLTHQARLHLLTAPVAIAVEWPVRAARSRMGFRGAGQAPSRKAHEYLAWSCFRTGFTFIRSRLRSRPENAVPKRIDLSN